MAKTPQQAHQAWLDSAGRAATNYAQGVQSYQGDWAGATTAQQTTMATNYQQAVSSGRWANGVNRVGTAGWKSRTQAKVGNFSSGFQAGADRQQASIAKVMQAASNIVGSLPPRGTHDQNVQRSVAFQNAMHALKGQLGA